MNLFDLIKREAKFVVNNSGFQQDIEMITKDGSQTINITGLASKISETYDSGDNIINTKNVHISIDESVLIALGYPYKVNKKGIEEVDLSGHKVNYIDSSGILRNYIVRENLPNETIGIIYLILGDYKPQ